MKRFIFTIVLIFGIAFAQFPTAHAVDYYVGNYGRLQCYLMTETIQELRHYSDGGRFSARLKIVNKMIQYIDYELDIGTSGIMYKESTGHSGEATPHGTPIVWNMSQYIARNYL